MDKRYLWALPFLAVLIWFLYQGQGVPELTLDQRATGLSYDPYVHWSHTSPSAWVKHYPDRIGPNCLGAVLANEEGAISTTTTMVDGSSVEGGTDGYTR